MADAGFVRLPLLVQTAYARLVDLLLTAEAGDLSAGTSLVSKRIRGHTYWYAQRLEDGKKVQSYLGRQTPELEALVERWRRARAEAADRAELVAMARAGGAYIVRADEARVMELLAGVFRMGAVLVGSHAFAVLGTMLGVRWTEASVRTDDVDIAHDVAVALTKEVPPLVLREALDDAIPRFALLDPGAPATSFQVRGTQIQVDLLTPLVGRDRGRPVHIPALGASATPLRYLDYLIEETQPAAVLGGRGALVHVPRPGRYALHKLIVAGRRGHQAAGTTKASKDRLQASALLRVLLADLPGEISLAWKAMSQHSAGAVVAVRDSLARLEPDLVDGLEAVGIARR